MRRHLRFLGHYAGALQRHHVEITGFLVVTAGIRATFMVRVLGPQPDPP